MPLFDVDTPQGPRKVWAKAGAPDSEIIANAKKQLAMESENNPATDMNFRAGMGKAFYDTARGIAQLFGADNQAVIDEARRLDASLMNTGSGIAGNIAGHMVNTMVPGGLLGSTAKMAGLPGWVAAGRSMLAPKTLAGSGILGGAYSGIQPVTEDGSRLQNTGIGALAGAGGQLAGRAIGGAWQGTKALTEPFRQSGRERLVGRTLSRYAGNPERAAQNMANAAEIVPGSHPTMAQVADDAGISQLERTIHDIDPAIGARLTDRYNAQNAARVGVLRDLAGDEAKMAAAKTARKITASPALRILNTTNAQADPSPTIGLIDKILKGQGGKRQSMRTALTSIRKNLIDDDVIETSPELLYGARKDIADRLNAKAPDGSKINEAIERELTTIMRSLDNQIRKAVPEYGDYMKAYAENSKPIDQMKVGLQLIKQTTSALHRAGDEVALKPEMYARALREGAQLIRKATGFKRGSLEKLLTDDQLAALRAVEKDLTRHVKGQASGKAFGSNTLQNMSSKNVLRQTLGPIGLPESWTEAGILNQMARPLDFAYGGMQPAINDVFLDAAINPQYGARLMQMGSDRLTPQGLLTALRSGSVTMPVGLLNAFPQ